MIWDFFNKGFWVGKSSKAVLPLNPPPKGEKEANWIYWKENLQFTLLNYFYRKWLFSAFPPLEGARGRIFMNIDSRNV